MPGNSERQYNDYMEETLAYLRERDRAARFREPDQEAGPPEEPVGFEGTTKRMLSTWARQSQPAKNRSKFILCEDGSYLAIKHISRLFAQEDGVTRKGAVKASVQGPAHPFTVCAYESLHAAKVALSELVAQIEEG